MEIEGSQNIESRESQIDKLIEELAREEDMDPNDIFSDIVTFAELMESDKDAAVYLEELAEKIGISFEEMVEYARKQVEGEK